MPLQKQTIGVNFGAGIDTKTDQKMVEGKLTSLENGEFQKGKEINKRSGYDQLNNRTNETANTPAQTANPYLPVGVLATGLPLTEADALISYNENQLLLMAYKTAWNYSSSAQRWLRVGDARQCYITRESQFVGPLSYAAPDFATDGVTGVYVADRGYAAQDLETGSIIRQVTSNPFLRRALFCDNKLFIFTLTTNTISVLQIDASTVFGLGTITGTLVTDATAGLHFEVFADGTNFILLYKNNLGSLSFRKFNATTLAAGVSNSFVAAPDIFSGGRTSTGGFYVISQFTVRYYDSSFVLQAGPVTPPGFSAIGATVEISTRVTTCVDSFDNLLIAGEKEVTGAFAPTFAIVGTSRVITQAVDTSLTDGVGLSISPSRLGANMRIASHAFTMFDTLFFFAYFDSDVQPTFYLLDRSYTVHAKFSANFAGGAGLTTPIVVGNKVYAHFPVIYELESDNGVFTSQIATARYVFDFDLKSKYPSALIGENLYTAGGIASQFDSVRMSEHGFLFYPEQPVASQNVVGAGGIPDVGTYLYYVTYEWIDAVGQLHRSAPSVPVSVTIAVANLRTVTLSILNQNTSLKTNTKIVIYRTEANGTVPYRITSEVSPLFILPSNSANTVQYTDDAADSTITANNILYTNGGVLENNTPPACKQVAVFKNRLIYLGLENDLEIAYSKTLTPGEGISFSDSFRIQVPPQGGPVTAGATLDDKFIIFKDNILFAMNGDGPNDLGQQNTFTSPEQIASDVGCSEPNSIVITPVGLMFKSFKGIYLLSRQLQVQYIGAEVEDFNHLTIVSATLLEDKNQVIFHTLESPTLVYDYYFQQWSTYTNHAGYKAVVYQGDYTYLRTNGRVYKNNASVFTDAGTGYRMSLTTQWMKFAGVQGFQRVRRFEILGDYKSAHSLQVQIAYDFEQTYSNTITFTTAVGVYQYRGHMPRQKCDSVRFLIQETDAAPAGESFSINDISFEAGIKQGLSKLSSARSSG